MNTIGDHIRKRRLDLKLFQQDLAKVIGVEEFTITNWEKNRVSPRSHYIPNIIEFLGYNPCDTESETLGEKIVAHRRVLGLTQKELAKTLGIDQTTLARWESNRGRPSKVLSGILAVFLNRASSWEDRQGRRKTGPSCP